MNICIFIPEMKNPGGTDRVAANLTKLFRSKNHNVDILVDDISEESFYNLPDDVKITSIKAKRNAVGPNKMATAIYYIKKTLEIRRFIIEKDIDVLIMIWTEGTVMWGTPATFFTKTKSIACEHTSYDEVGYRWKRLRKIYYRLTDAVVALTARDADKYKQISRRVAIIPNAISGVFFTNNEQIKKECKTVINVGHIHPIKGQDMLLSAWSKVCNEIDDWQLRIIGKAVDVKHYNDLAMKIEEHPLKSRTKLVGPTKDIIKEYLNAEILVLSSRAEGLPMVLIEAMSVGVVTVSFDCPTGPREIIVNDKTGILVENGNVEKLADALIRVINDSELRSNYSIAAKVDVKKRFNEARVYDLWMALFKEIGLRC